MQEMCHKVLEEGAEELKLSSDSKTSEQRLNNLGVAMALEKVALNDKYFIDRKLFPNVDFYSGIVLQEIGFPRDMFTVMFALA
jgi:citrate synthase